MGSNFTHYMEDSFFLHYQDGTVMETTLSVVIRVAIYFSCIDVSAWRHQTLRTTVVLYKPNSVQILCSVCKM